MERHRLVPLACLSLLLGAGCGASSGLPGSSTPAAPLSWSIVSGSTPAGITDSLLNGVTCVSTSDCWAVGEYHDQTLTRIAHDAGRGWNVVASPTPSGSTQVYLEAVTCTGASDCWAVGRYTQADDGDIQTLIEHYAGSDWSIVSSPNPSRSKWDELARVTCVSASDCWAGGAVTYLSSYGGPDDVNDNQFHPLIEHYSGSGWNIVSSPAPSGSTQLYLNGISCAGADDCWVVGYYNSAPLTSAANDQTLIEHDAGSGWSIVASPNPSGSANSQLSAVNCVSAGDCWAVGSAGNVASDSVAGSTTLIEHNTGSGWSIVSSSTSSGVTDSELSGVTCVSSSDCWAVGSYAGVDAIASASASASAILLNSTLVEHDAGSGWSIVPSPTPSGSTQVYLPGLTCASASGCWAVGYSSGGALIEQGRTA